MQGCIKCVCTEFKHGCLYVVEPSRCTDAPTINDHDCNGCKTLCTHSTALYEKFKMLMVQRGTIPTVLQTKSFGYVDIGGIA